MGEDGVAVDPVALVVDQPLRVELTRGDHEVAQGAVGSGVAIHRQLLGERVEVLALLELSERGADDRGIEQADVRGGGPVGGHLLGRGGGVTAVVAVRHVVFGEPVRVSGGRDASRDVFAFLLRSVGLDADLLDHQRPAGSDDDRAEQQQHQADRRDPQIFEHQRGEHCGRADDGDGQQDQLRGQHRVDIGVTGAGEGLTATGMRQQLVAVQPIRERLQQHQHTEQRHQLDTCRLAQHPRTAGQADTAEDVVADQVHDERQEQRHHDVGQHQPVERQVERIEPEIEPELRIGDTELTTVQEQLDAHPVALRHQSGQQADGHRDTDPDQFQPRENRSAVPRDRIVGPGDRNEDRAGAVRQSQTGEDDGTHREGDDEEHHDPGEQHRGEDGSVAEFAEPQPVDVGVDEPWTDQQQHHRHQGDRDQKPTAPSQLRHPGGGPHTHVLTPWW